MAEITLNLLPGGKDVENNNYHTLDAYPGQVERADVYDYGSKLNMQMNLVEIVHGTMNSKPDSPPATLIIADFQFISHDPSRRFRHADIELRFRDTDARDSNPPEVFAIAPHRTYTLNKTEKTQTLTRGAKLDVGASFVANVTTGLEWSMSTTGTQYSVAKVIGACQMVKRSTEPKNAAVWSLSENKNDDNGIPSLLRTAILLKRKTNAQFYCSLVVGAKVDWLKRVNLESRTAGGDINPVLFDPTKPRTTPVPDYIDVTNLGSVRLTDLMAIQTTNQIAPASVVQVNTAIDGQESGLTRENVMSRTQKAENTGQERNDPVQEPATHISAEKTIPAVGEQVSNLLESAIPVLAPRKVNTFDGVSGTELKNVIRELGIQNGESSSTRSQERLPHVTLENGTRTTQKEDTSSTILADTSESARVLQAVEETSLEETMRLLLHAVRKGVEVMAEAVSTCMFLL